MTKTNLLIIAIIFLLVLYNNNKSYERFKIGSQRTGGTNRLKTISISSGTSTSRRVPSGTSTYRRR